MCADSNVPGTLLHYSSVHAIRVGGGGAGYLGPQGQRVHHRLAQGLHPAVPEILGAHPAAHWLQLLAVCEGYTSPAENK